MIARTFAWAALVLCPALSASAADLAVGDEAPAFSLVGSDGQTYTLADFRDQQVVVVAWFPKAFTGGCTKECKSLAAHGEAIRAFDVAYFTASCDTQEDNAKFAESLGLDYPILCDPSKEVAQAYGVVHEGREVPERWTFYIGLDGTLLYIDKGVMTESHGADIAARLQELGVAAREAE